MQLQTINLCRITTQMTLACGFYSWMPIICTAIQWVSPFQRDILNFCLLKISKNLICKKQRLPKTLDSFSKSILSIQYIFMSYLMIIPLLLKMCRSHTICSSQSLINKYSSTEKLAPNLNDKIKYVLHYENLRVYLEFGIELVKIHRILQFCQSA